MASFETFSFFLYQVQDTHPIPLRTPFTKGLTAELQPLMASHGTDTWKAFPLPIALIDQPPFYYMYTVPVCTTSHGAVYPRKITRRKSAPPSNWYLTRL